MFRETFTDDLAVADFPHGRTKNFILKLSLNLHRDTAGVDQTAFDIRSSGGFALMKSGGRCVSSSRIMAVTFGTSALVLEFMELLSGFDIDKIRRGKRR